MKIFCVHRELLQRTQQLHIHIHTLIVLIDNSVINNNKYFNLK